MKLTRRTLLKSGGALVVMLGFRGTSSAQRLADLGGAGGKPLDVNEVDGFLAIHRDGSVTLYSGKVDLGQGLRIAIPQMAAEELGVDVGRITLVGPDADTFVYSPQVCFWRSLDAERLSPFVLHAWMRSPRFIAQIDAVKGQTDMADYVSIRDQRAMHFDLPEPEVQSEVAWFAEPLARAASAARKEARTLTAIRDALLPKLVLGQIRVPLSNDVDELIGVATEALA